MQGMLLVVTPIVSHQRHSNRQNVGVFFFFIPVCSHPATPHQAEKMALYQFSLLRPNSCFSSALKNILPPPLPPSVFFSEFGNYLHWNERKKKRQIFFFFNFFPTLHY